PPRTAIPPGRDCRRKGKTEKRDPDCRRGSEEDNGGGQAGEGHNPVRISSRPRKAQGGRRETGELEKTGLALHPSRAAGRLRPLRRPPHIAHTAGWSGSRRVCL